MTFKAVTTAQLEQVRKMANDKGIGKDVFQRGLDDGAVAAMLDRINSLKPETPTPLLARVDTIEVPAVARFVAADHFKSGVAGITFWFGDNFKRHFLGKVEENVPAATLAINRLNRSSVDGPIRRELGAEREEIALAHFYELIKNQPRGERGKLPTDGTWIIAYIKDDKGNLWAVRASWYSFDREWSVDAYSVGNPCEWFAGYQVLSQVA